MKSDTHDSESVKLPAWMAAAACAALLLCPLASGASTWFRGAEEVHSKKSVAVIDRLDWGMSPKSPDRDRLHGSIGVDAKDMTNWVAVVFQSFDMRGNLLKSFTVVPRTTPPSYGKAFKCEFDVEFPKDANARYLKVVNVVVDDNEVRYDLRIPENRIVRGFKLMPDSGAESAAEIWDESERGGWLPQAKGKGAMTFGKGGRATPSGAARFLSADKGQLKLDVVEIVSAVTAIANDTGMDKAAVRNFASRIEKANLVAAAKWGNLRKVIFSRLDEMTEKAKSSGNVDLVLKIKELRQSLESGEGWGDDSEFNAMRDAFDKQFSKIRLELVQEGLSSGKALNAALEGHVRVLMEKDSLDAAKAVRDIQKSIQSWASGVKGGRFGKPDSFAVAAKASDSPAPVGAEGVVTIDANNFDGVPIGKVSPGDVVEISYVSGKWCRNQQDPWESPDEEGAVTFLQLIEIGKVTTTRSPTVWGTEVKKVMECTVLANIPCNTRGNPFRYVVDGGVSGKVVLHMGGPSGMSKSSSRAHAGFVRYSVKVIKGGNSGEPTARSDRARRDSPPRGSYEIPPSLGIPKFDPLDLSRAIPIPVSSSSLP